MTYHREEVDDGVRLVQGNEERRLGRVLAQVDGVLFGHVQLHVAEMCLEEPAEPLYPHDRCRLVGDVCVRVLMLWLVGVGVGMGVGRD